MCAGGAFSLLEFSGVAPEESARDLGEIRAPLPPDD